MEVFVTRHPRGYLAGEMENAEELQEHLSADETLLDTDEVSVEITAPWSKVREMLNKLGDEIWFRPGIACGGCGATAVGTADNLPPGWKIRRHRGGFDFRCPKCQK